MAQITDRGRYRASAVEFTTPAMDLTDPQPVEARHATRRLLAGAELDGEARDDLVSAVSEVTTNAALHGEPPVRVLGWVSPVEAVVTITDSGDGPADPEAGLFPARRDPGEGGFGLWLAHQLCSEVVMGRHHRGFTVRLVARS